MPTLSKNPAKTGAVLQVRNLRTGLRSRGQEGYPVDGVSFELGAGEVVALVGESGSGKSLTALSILRLNPYPASWIDSGTVEFDGVDLFKLSDKRLRRYRGRHIGLVLQDPQAALNPVLTIGTQLQSVLKLHRRGSRQRRDLRAEAIARLSRLRVPDPASRLSWYPHQFSGGMKQRIVSAIAMAGDPEFLIADEPTTSLDVTVQAAYLELLRDLQVESGLGILLITHDLHVVRSISDRVLVMYAGRVVESAPKGEFFQQPLHPYSRALLEAMPSLDGPISRMHGIPGSPPSIFEPKTGCPFASRCTVAMDICHREYPPEKTLPFNRTVTCWKYV